MEAFVIPQMASVVTARRVAEGTPIQTGRQNLEQFVAGSFEDHVIIYLPLVKLVDVPLKDGPERLQLLLTHDVPVDGRF